MLSNTTQTLDADDLDEDADHSGASFTNEQLLVRHGNDATKTISSYTMQNEGTSLVNDALLFTPLNLNVNLSTSHSEQVHIFRLWQIYLDNVNPLLKVTHTPTL